MVRSLRVRGVLAAAILAWSSSPAGAAVGFDVASTTVLAGQNSRTQTYSGRLTLVDQTFGASLGGVAGDPPAAIGAEIHGSITPTLALDASVLSSQLTKFGAAVSSTTQIRGADGMASSNAGQTFTLATTSTQAAGNYMSIDDTYSAAVDLRSGVKLDAGARGCLGGCLMADFAIDLGGGLARTELFGIDPAGSARVLGVDIGGGPFSYADPTGIVTVSGNVPNFDGNSANVAGGPAISSRQGLVGLSVDVAQAFATAVGLPFDLKGEIAGFDYTILSASIGAGLDIVKTVAFEAISTGANYVFSAPVSVFNAATNAWSDLTTSWFTQADGSELQVRAPGALSVGVSRYDALVGNLNTSVELVSYLSGNITALGLSGYGLEFGPLLDKTIIADLGTISLGGHSEIVAMSQLGDSFNLTFSSNLIDNVDPCAAGCSATGFVDLRDSVDVPPTFGEVYSSRIAQVTNFGAGCSVGDTASCIFDPNVAALTRQVVVDQLAIEPTVSGEDVVAFYAALNTPDFLAAQSSDAAALARIYATGFDPLNPPPFGGMGSGAPPLTQPVASASYELRFTPGVPEPSTWLLLIGGFGLAGARLRRRPALGA